MVSSSAGEFGVAAQPAYCASRNGLLGLMRAVAQDVGPYGVTCNAVLPGWTKTPMADALVTQMAADQNKSFDEVWKEAVAAYPARRPVDPQEVADTIAFLASDARERHQRRGREDRPRRCLVSSFDYWIRRSAFFDGARRAGCSRYSFANHMFQPAAYGDQNSLEAYWHLVNGVTLWDVGTERQVEITGPRRAGVHELTHTARPDGVPNRPLLLHARDVRGRRDRQRSRTAAPERRPLLASRPRTVTCCLWVKGVAVNSKFDVAIGEPDVSPLQIQGPKSSAVVDALFGGRISPRPLPIGRGGSRRHSGGRFANGVERRDWIRDFPARRPLRRHALGPRVGRRQTLSDHSHRPLRCQPRGGRILAYRSDMDSGPIPSNSGSTASCISMRPPISSASPP